MKAKKAILAVIFIAGLAIGLLAGLLVPRPQLWSEFSDQYAFDVVEQVTLASELRAGQHNQIRERIEAKLPAYVLALHRNPRMRSSQTVDPLSVIKSYYTNHQVPIPDEIRAILNEVPEVDFCVIHRN